MSRWCNIRKEEQDLNEAFLDSLQRPSHRVKGEVRMWGDVEYFEEPWDGSG